MQAISRIIQRVHFKEYNIPESFGEQAQIIILPVNNIENDNDSKVNTVHQAEEEYKLLGMTDFFETNDDATINWEEYFGTK